MYFAISSNQRLLLLTSLVVTFVFNSRAAAKESNKMVAPVYGRSNHSPGTAKMLV
jgi:hypothetical protein